VAILETLSQSLTYQNPGGHQKHYNWLNSLQYRNFASSADTESGSTVLNNPALAHQRVWGGLIVVLLKFRHTLLIKFM
jgi:hypothetical protein